MARHVGALIAFALVTALGGCNSTSMSGASSRRIEQADSTAKPAADDKEAEELGKTKPGKYHDDEDTGDNTADDPVMPNNTDIGANGDQNLPNNNTDIGTSNSTITPDGIVDGMEVINSCDRCVARAQQLSQTIGFTADIRKTYNLGFYKIDPSQNLCDIHFMQDMTIKISNHAGQNSVLDRQIAFYCPCNCGWASTDPFDYSNSPL